MSKLRINTTLNYSPNFDSKKRKLDQIKFIIFHYTGMRKEKEAINKLTSSKSKVSSHYFIKNNGEILSLVPDTYNAWHAGLSFWQKYKSINQYSLGIEINNPGHDHIYKKFSKKQIDSIVKLTLFLIKKYKIKKKFILGHSDIAPERKKDPGEKFPWKYLSKKQIGYWHDFDEKKILTKRSKNLNEKKEKKFIQNLFKIGYRKYSDIKNSKKLKIYTKVFQRRFRQELVDGIADEECLTISENIAKKMK